MGCLKSIIKKIIFIALVVAFFAFGGYTFTVQKIKEYQNPPRSKFIETEKNYGDFSRVSGDYQLCRNFNLFGYKKINAKYLPTEQKITIYDLKDENKISPQDFENGEIDNKINALLDKFKDSVITFEDFKIIQKDFYNAKNKKVPYLAYQAKVKNLPFKNVMGVIACYSTKNPKNKKDSTKLVLYMVDVKAFNPAIVRDFVQAIEF